MVLTSLSKLELEEVYFGYNFLDDPLLADLQKHEVQNNDILVVGSDGLFDNMYDHQITDIINPFIKDKDEILDTELVAQLIAKQAEVLSLDPNWKSPFAKHAYDNYYDFKGGKHDDITVLVSQIRIRDIE